MKINMSYQNISRFVVICSILFAMGYSAILMKQRFYDEKKLEIVASGVIEGKFESDYSCGSKGRYTCYSRYLIIGGVKHSVFTEVFTQNNIGDIVTLTVEENIENTIPQILILMVGVVCWFLLLCVILFFVFWFIHWSLFWSEEQSFKEYFMED